MKYRKIHVESNEWITAERWKKIYRFDDEVGLSESIDQLAMANSVHLYGHV